MTLLQLEVFRKVIETGGFTKAGEALGLTQSAVSHAIKGLESELEITLIHRGRNGILITNEGERMLGYVRNILNLREQMIQEAASIKGLETGNIRLGTFSSVSAKLLPGILKSFRERYPNITIEFFEGGYAEIKDWLMQGNIDIGFITLSSEQNVETVPLIKDDLIVVLSDSHPLAKQPLVNIEDIATEPFIMPKDGCDLLVKKIFKMKNLNPKIAFEIADNNTIVSMVKEKIGISIVPEMTIFSEIEGISTPKLNDEAYRTIGLALNRHKTVSPALHAFIQIAKEFVVKKGYIIPDKLSKYCIE